MFYIPNISYTLSMQSAPKGSIYVPIVGGLGNQMFLIATGIATALRNRMSLTVPHVSSSDSCAAPRPVYWQSMLQKIPECMTYVEKPRAMLVPGASGSVPSIPEHAVVLPETSPEIKINCKDKSKTGVLRGFFQSPVYFDDFEDHVKHLLVPDGYIARAQRALDGYLLCNESAPNRIQQRPKCIGIHIRRGDYLTMREVFPILSPQEYYLPALESLLGARLLETVDAAQPCPLRVLIFSEDATYGELFRDMLRCAYPLFGQHSESVQLCSMGEDYLELLAMSLCDDLIIANSSFSWWSGYLHRKPLGRVISPERWFIGRSPRIQCPQWRKM